LGCGSAIRSRSSPWPLARLRTVAADERVGTLSRRLHVEFVRSLDVVPLVGRVACMGCSPGIGGLLMFARLRRTGSRCVMAASVFTQGSTRRSPCVPRLAGHAVSHFREDDRAADVSGRRL
jgi:hypothetical protein